jgi:hypothetical protein
MIKERNKKPSATCLTGIQSQQDLYHHIKQFSVDSKVNRFRAEDYYFIRNNIPLQNNKEAVKAEPKDDREVIHVMIDYASLVSLSQMNHIQPKNPQQLQQDLLALGQLDEWL